MRNLCVLCVKNINRKGRKVKRKVRKEKLKNMTTIYIALLRGINVGGKNIIKMETLKQLFIDMEFSDVKTYIQSGNVVFSTKEVDREKLVRTIEKGKNAIYTSRLTSEMGRSYFSKIMQTPVYKSITIRNWNTTKKLLEMTVF